MILLTIFALLAILVCVAGFFYNLNLNSRNTDGKNPLKAVSREEGKTINEMSLQELKNYISSYSFKSQDLHVGLCQLSDEILPKIIDKIIELEKQDKN